LITTFNFTVTIPFLSGQHFLFRTFAVNGVGQGAYSSYTAATGDLVPQFMNAPIVLTSQITPQWIFITWSGISTTSQTGGDPASYYGIEWDQGNGNWVNLTTPAVGLTYSFNLTSSVPFVSGLTINLRGFAKNGVGVGVYSAITTVTCD